jgi:uncharacterized protein (DUF1330 family)
MKYYSIAELNVTDRQWVASYLEQVTPMVERHGGRYLVRTNNFERMEGDRESPHLLLVIEWPAREAAMAFYASAEYAPHLRARLAGSTGQFYLARGEDMHRLASAAP